MWYYMLVKGKSVSSAWLATPLILVTVWLAALAAKPTAAAEPTPAGLWKTIDDKTGSPKGFVRIYEQDGLFFGKVEGSVKPEDALERCDRCSGERKDKPVVGMVILRRLKNGSGSEYSGGDILDPDTGTVYRCSFRMSEQGTKLIVRGYLGLPILGRSQVWIRER
jgi:uncharacterized protein (DUF2147 family)